MRSRISLFAVAGFFAVAFAGCSLDLDHYGAFDPESPDEKKAKSHVSGVVRLQGESDFSSVDIKLQNTFRTYTVQSDAAGSYLLTGIVPGEYALSISTRYFDPVSETIVVGIGKKVSLPNFTLEPKRSTVKGSALAERLVNRQFVGEGGVVIALEKSGSIRGGDGGSAPFDSQFVSTSVDLPADGTISDGDGSFSLSGVPAGYYILIASASGLTTIRIGSVEVTGEEDISVEPIILRAVSGFFDIVGSADFEASSRYTQSPWVTLRLSGFNAEEMQIGKTDSGLPEDCEFDPKEAFFSTKQHYLSKEGTNIICVKYFAADGRESGVQTGSILYDPTPPLIYSDSLKVLDAVDGYIQSFQVSLELKSDDSPVEDSSGLVKMQILDLPFGDPEPSFANAATQPYVLRPSYTLPAADGKRTIWVRFADRAGNYTLPVSASVTLDRVPPALGGIAELQDLSGNVVDLDNPTNSNQIYLRLDVEDVNPVFVKISDRSDFLGASWAPHQMTMPVNNIQASVNPLGTERSVFVKIRDSAGHEFDAGEYKFIIDTIAPAIVSMNILGNGIFPGNNLTTDTVVDVDFTYEPNDSVSIELASDGGFQNKADIAAPGNTASASVTFTVSAGDGVKFLYSRFRDKAGNVSATVIDQIVLDTVPPQLTSLAIQGGEYTQQTQVNLQTGAADAAQMQIFEGLDCAGGTWESYATSKPKFFDGTPTVVEALKTFSVKYRDAAGNESECLSRSVRYDKTPPAFPPSTFDQFGTEIKAFRAMNSNYATITTTNVLQYYIALAVTDASPVTVQFSDDFASIIDPLWDGVPKEQVRARRDWLVWDRPTNPAGEQRYTVIRLEDAAGNVKVDYIEVTVALLKASLELPVYTELNTINVLLGGSNATKLWLSELPSFATFEEYALAPTQTNVTYSLSSGDGGKTLYGRFFDSAGSYADTLANTTLDTEAPTSVSFALDNGLAYSKNPAGTVSLSALASDSATFVQSARIANITTPGQTCAAALNAGGTVRTYPLTATSWTLAAPLGANVEGKRWVCIQYADVLGNFTNSATSDHWSTPVSDAIQYDTLIPQVNGGEGIYINGADPYTNSRYVDLALPVTGAAFVRFSNNGGPFSSLYAYAPLFQDWPLDDADGLQSVSVEFVDGAGNVAGPYTASITLDRIGPDGDALGINSGALYTNSASVTLQTFANTAVTMEVSNSASFFGASVYAYGTTVSPWILSSDQGMKTVWIRYTDIAENTSTPITATITYDNGVPTGTSVSINGGAPYLTESDGRVDLLLAATDLTTWVDTMKVANKPAGQTCTQVLSGATPQVFATSINSWELADFGTDKEGQRYVCAQFKDIVGNWSSPVSDAITYDTLIPQVGSGNGVYINSGATMTNDALGDVELTFPVTGATQVRVSNDNGPYTGWMSLSNVAFATWRLAGASLIYDGLHSVHAEFKDAAGNLAGPYAATITFDRQAPTGGSVSINSAALLTNSSSVNLTLSAADGPVKMDISNGAFFDFFTQYTYAASLNGWLLGSAQGNQEVWVRYVDIANNYSTPVSDNIGVDSLPPVAGGVLINGSNPGPVTNNTTVSMTLPVADANDVEVNLSSTSCGTGAYAAWTSPMSFSLPGTGDATYTVYARYRDAILNQTEGCVTASIRIDTQVIAPTFAVSFTGASVYAGRTSQATAPMVPVNAGTDAVQMITTSTGDFTGSIAQAIGTVNVSLPADTSYTISVKLLDAVPNTGATVYTATIEKDSTPPAAPVLSLDTSGDGLAYTLTTVDLTWDAPVDADIGGYLLQRSVGGGSYATIYSVNCTSPCAGVRQYTDTFGTSGSAHEYRVLAQDTLNNRSTSNSVITTPIQPLGRIFQIRNTEQYEYFFAPTAPANFSSGTYYWDGGNSTVSATNYPVLNYAPAATRWNEQLVLPIAEPSAADLYTSTFDLLRSSRKVVDTTGTPGNGSAIAVDQYGYSHMVYRHEAPLGLYYATNKSGVWVTSLVTTDNAENPAINVARDGRVHIAYYAADNFDLKYVNRLSGSWPTPTVLVAGASLADYQGRWIAMDYSLDGRLHISFVGVSAGVTNRYYMVRSAAGVWGLQVVVEALGTPDATQQLGASMHVRSTGVVHLAYYHAGNRELRHARSNDGLSFTYTTMDTVGDAGQFNALSEAPDGDLYVGYIETGTRELRYMARSGGVWANAVTLSTAPAPVTGQVSIAVDLNEKIHVTYYREGVGLVLMSNGDGAWKSFNIDTGDDAGLSNSVAADARGKLHFAYAGPANAALRYASFDRFAAHTQTVVASGVAASAMAVDVTGTVHMVYRNGTDLFYTTNKEGAWSTAVNIDAGKVVNSNPAIALDSTSLPHVVFLDDSADGYYRRLQSNGTWTAALLFSNDNVEKTFADHKGPAIAIDSANKVYVAYRKDNAQLRFSQKTSAAAAFTFGDMAGVNNNESETVSLAASGTLVSAAWYDFAGDDIEFAQYNGSSWSTGEADVVVDDTTADQPIIRAGSYGLLHMIYIKGNTVQYRSGNATGTAWSAATQIDAITGPDDPFLAVGQDNSLHVLAYDAANGLRYSSDQSGSWIARTLVSGALAGSTAAMGFDQNYIPHATFNTNGVLKYMKAFSGWLPATGTTTLR